MHRKERLDRSYGSPGPARDGLADRNDALLLPDRIFAARPDRAGNQETTCSVVEFDRKERFPRAIQLVQACYDRRFQRCSIRGLLLSEHSTRGVLRMPA